MTQVPPWLLGTFVPQGRKGARNLRALSIEANDEEAWD